MRRQNCWCVCVGLDETMVEEDLARSNSDSSSSDLVWEEEGKVVVKHPFCHDGSEKRASLVFQRDALETSNWLFPEDSFLGRHCCEVLFLLNYLEKERG